MPILWLEIVVLRLLAAIAAALILIAASASGELPSKDQYFTGSLTVIQRDDPDRDETQLFYTIDSGRRRHPFHRRGQRGRRVRAHRSPVMGPGHSGPERLRSGMMVRVRGRLEGAEIVIASEEAVGQVEILATSSASEVPAVENRSVVVLLGDFQDLPLECSAAAVDTLMFGATNSVAANYLETSFGLVTLSGNVFGPYPIPYASTGGNYPAWSAAMEVAAVADGVDLSGYQHRLYVLPKNGTGSMGFATVGTPSVGYASAWVFRCDRPGVFAHETGHNLEFGHASRYFVETGDLWTFGDQTDNMGGQIELRHYNGPHKLTAGWIPEQRITRVKFDGEYTIRRLEDTANVPQLLHIDNPAPHFWGTQHYWVSYRVGIGTDQNLPTQYHERLFIHESADPPHTTYLRTWLDLGETFEEPAPSPSSVRVTLVGRDAETATILVSGVGHLGRIALPGLSPGAIGVLGLVLVATGGGAIMRRSASEPS